jgi:shikimate dehydrogenase
LVIAARAKGLMAIDGKEMLVRQAALSYRLWTGIDAPLDVMRGSLSGR